MEKTNIVSGITRISKQTPNPLLGHSALEHMGWDSAVDVEIITQKGAGETRWQEGCAAITKYHRLRWLKPEKLIFFPQFCRVDFPDLGASQLGSWWEISSWLADRYLLDLSSHGLSSGARVCVRACLWGSGQELEKERERSLMFLSLPMRTLVHHIKALPLWPCLT